MKVRPIGVPLPGEHLTATSPRIRPETDDARWRVRLDFWAGRALTAEALELEQENRAARLAWRGRLATPGIVSGIEVALEPPASPHGAATPAGHFVHILPGHGLLVDGEDLVVPRPLRVPLDRIPLGEGRTFNLGGREVAVFRTRSGIFATDAMCPHKTGRLADGLVGDGKVICPLHGFKFALATGEPIGNDCGSLLTYRTALTSANSGVRSRLRAQVG